VRKFVTRWAAPAIAIVVWAWGTAARAAPWVDLSADGCTDIPMAEVRRLVDADLGTASVRQTKLMANARAQARLACASRVIRVEVVDSATGHADERELPLDLGPPSFVSRLVALAITEQLAVLWTEEARAPNRTDKRSTQESSAVLHVAAAKVALAPSSSWRFLATANARSFPRTDLGVAMGGGVGVDKRLSRVSLHGDLVVAKASQAVSLGRASALLVDGSVATGVERHIGWFAFGADVGVRVGLARLSGEAAASAGAVAPRVVQHTLGGPILAAIVTAPMSHRTVACLSLEGGFVLRGVVGEIGGRSETEVSGPWLAAALGLAFTP
jgi:hypothetical protein